MVKVYSIGCPACNVLAKKLINADVPFQVIYDENIHNQLNITIFPMMQIDDGPLMSLGEARDWINSLGGKTTNGNN